MVYDPKLFLASPSNVELVVISNDTSVDEGEAVSLTCVGYGTPYIEIQWIRNGETLSNTSVISIHEEEIMLGNWIFTQSFLQLCSLALTDSGSYTCVVSNGIISVNSSVDLTITGTKKSLKVKHNTC